MRLLRPISIAILCLLTACETTVKKDVVTPQTSVTINGSDQHQSGSGAHAGTLDQALGTDETGVRLDKIVAALLLHFSVNRELPQHLTDLLPLDSGLQLNNPSNQPYIYTRDGLGTPGSAGRIIVNDPTPTANHRRWCIILDGTPKGAFIQLEVQPLPENLFLGYR